jgi:hypothetical protein
MPHFVDSKINENLEIATEYFKALVSYNQKDAENKLKKSAGSIGFIPYNISFTMDGISGIKIYNELSLDTSFLPAGYTKTTDFIVTGVDHKVQNGDWETNVNVTLIPRTSPIENNITGSIKIIGQTEEAQIDAPLRSNAPSSTTPNLSGPGLDPIKQLIVSVESGGDYDIYNYGPSGGSGIRTVSPGSKYYSANAVKLTNKTITQVLTLQSGAEDLFAVGKYQTIPDTLRSVATKMGLLTNLFDKTSQEQIGDYLLLTTRTRLGAYLKGTNDGSQSDLANAVQDLGQEFASLPIITKDGVTYGNVATGEGKTTYYGGQGPNKSSSKYNVATVVKAIIKSRIQYSSKNPTFIPSYYS